MDVQIPVIYPSTLTEEQRKIIKAMFHHYEKRIIHSSDDMNGFIAEGHVDAFLWLFGEDFFEKGE